MRRISGKAEEERLRRAQLSPFEGVRDPFAVAGEFQLARKFHFAANAARDVLVQTPRQVAMLQQTVMLLLLLARPLTTNGGRGGGRGSGEKRRERGGRRGGGGGGGGERGPREGETQGGEEEEEKEWKDADAAPNAHRFVRTTVSGAKGVSRHSECHNRTIIP